MTWTDPLLTAFETGDVLSEANVKTYVLDNLYSLLHPVAAPTTAELDINTSTAETTVFSVTVPANTMGTTGAVSMRLFGDCLHNNAAGDTVTIRVKFGGITLFSGSTPFISATGANRQPWYSSIYVFNTGATNAQTMHGEWRAMGANTAAPATGLGGLNNQTDGLFASVSGASTVDTTTNQSFLVSAQWSASSANNSFRRRWAMAYIGKN